MTAITQLPAAQTVIRDRPNDPYNFIADQFRVVQKEEEGKLATMFYSKVYWKMTQIRYTVLVEYFKWFSIYSYILHRCIMYVYIRIYIL